jgi:hypothetical protein
VTQRARLGGDELDVPFPHLAVKGAARPGEHGGVRRLDAASPEHDPPGLRVDEQQGRLESEARKERGDGHGLVLYPFEDASDLGRRARHEAGLRLVDGVQTL